MSYRGIDGQQLLCPSARCDEGALLVGIIGIEGKVAYVSPAPRVDNEFIEEAQSAGAPEQRFRFAAPCRESGCVHCTGTRCGVIDAALAAAEAAQTRQCASSPLPRCGIRTQCRWFAQTGSNACATCPFLSTTSGRKRIPANHPNSKQNVENRHARKQNKARI
jgi:hypothetical protein